MAEKSSEAYEWLSIREAVLHRPDAYLGSNTSADTVFRLYGEDLQVYETRMEMSPIFTKIFDEVLINATDAAWRDRTLRNIFVCYTEGKVTIRNDGAGIPIVHFKDTGRYIPEIIFSELNAGSNFDDSATRFSAGRNGVGVSCCNIWSRTFDVSVCDGVRNFTQSYSDNMTIVSPCSVCPARKGAKGYVEVAFVPDYARMHIDAAAHQVLLRDLLRTRTIECSITVMQGTTITFDGEKLKQTPVLHATNYMGLKDVCVEEIGKRTTGAGITLLCGERTHGSIEASGFVNCLRCPNGTHTHTARERVNRALCDIIHKKHPGLHVRPQTMKDMIGIMCVASIPNPTFSSQSKDCLTTPLRQFSFNLELSSRLTQKLSKLAAIDEISRRDSERELAASLRKATGPKTKDVLIDKYDAALLNRRCPQECTLILTEGDSAKALAVAGLSVVGRERYGIFPLRGVLLNVRNAPIKKALDNAEIANILRILNVQPGGDGKSLRYGRIAVMSDQDLDGTHICGLLLNALVHLCPSVVANNSSFLSRIVTPLIRARKGRDERCFYSAQEYNQWNETLNNAQKKEWSLKYYKGLGTSTNKEAKELFSHLSEHLITFTYTERSDSVLANFYDDSQIAKRKEMLTGPSFADRKVDYRLSNVTIEEFMDNEHIHFSFYSVFRALPCALDGLTPSRRKVMYYFLTSRTAAEIKVAQAASAVAGKTVYLHGENSLVETIVGLAQDHVGTNNIALLEPIGQFGSRNNKPSVHAAARYLYTRLMPIARVLFPSADFPILDYRVEEHTEIEPFTYVPVLPLVLINGATGIGTGFSTTVPCYNLTDICEACRCYSTGQPIPQMRPYFCGFRGDVTQGARSIITKGVWERVDDHTLTVRELPIGKWTETFLSELKCLTGDKRALTVTAVENKSTEKQVHITITVSECLSSLSDDNIAGALKLCTHISTSNMYLFNSEYTLTHYADPAAIVIEHGTARIALYEKRRVFTIKAVEAELATRAQKLSFIKAVLEDRIELKGKPKATLVEELEVAGIPGVDAPTDGKGPYDALLNIPVSSFTEESISKLTSDILKQEKELEKIKRALPTELWIAEIADVEQSYRHYCEELETRYSDSVSANATNRTQPKRRVAKRKIQATLA